MCSARRWRRRARWHKVLPRERDPLFVSVNVSSRQLFRQDLVQEIRLMLASEAVPKGTLKLEITESLVMENPERAVEILTWLKTFGASLALDDFGTGYCSLELSAPLPLRHHQGRPLAGARQRAQRLDAADPALDHRARARARQGGGGRGRGDRGGRSLSPLDRLRVRPGLLLRGADGGQGGGETCLSALASHRKRQQRERSRAAASGPCRDLRQWQDRSAQASAAACRSQRPQA